MIQKIDLFQSALHYKKTAMLDKIDPQSDGFYVMRNLLEELNGKLDEIIDHVNKLEGNGLIEELAAHKKDLGAVQRLMGANPSQAQREVLSQFVNPGESSVTISAGNVLGASDKLTDYDVVLVKRMDAETANFAPIADVIIQSAKKRAILGIHESLLEQWNFYMARVPFHWEAYEYMDSDDGIEYFIIDKLEGQSLETLAP